MSVTEPPYRIVDGVALIEMRLDKVQQLFSTLDPSPFRTRDLNPQAEAYIVGAVEELPKRQPVRLVVSVAGPDGEGVHDVETAVHHYFDYQRWAVDRRLRGLLREGRMALVIGVAFLIACLCLSRIALSLVGGIAGDILSEGLFICSWVAMWRPIQIFLFDWWPLARRRRLFATLKEIPIEVIPTASESKP